MGSGEAWDLGRAICGESSKQTLSMEPGKQSGERSIIEATKPWGGRGGGVSSGVQDCCASFLLCRLLLDGGARCLSLNKGKMQETRHRVSSPGGRLGATAASSPVNASTDAS